MREITLFGEDNAHRQIISALTQRLAAENGIHARLEWRSAVRGHGMVVRRLRAYLQEMSRHTVASPDLIIVATDANCHGLNHRIREINAATATATAPSLPIITAIPDPHIERWLLLDGAAFRQALGRGCQAPQQKCNRDIYKQHLIDAILAAGITPTQGGIEYAPDIVQEMDLDRAKRADHSLQLFLDNLANQFRQWSQQPAP